MVEELVLKCLDQLRHDKGNFVVIKLRKLLDSKKTHFDVAELTIEEHQSLIGLHVLRELAILKHLVTRLRLHWVREVYQLYVNRQFLNKVHIA